MIYPITGRRPGAAAYYPKPLIGGDGNVIPLRRKLRVRVTPGRMSDPCWEIPKVKGGRRNPNRYVLLTRVDGTVVAAHRWVWAATHLIEPQPGQVVHHLCFRSGCVNPAHLRLASFEDNSRMSNFPTRYVQEAA